MQIISAFLMGSNKILLFKSYFIYIYTPPRYFYKDFLIIQLKFLFSVPSEEDLRSTVMMICRNETGLLSDFSSAATEFWKLAEISELPLAPLKYTH